MSKIKIKFRKSKTISSAKNIPPAKTIPPAKNISRKIPKKQAQKKLKKFFKNTGSAQKTFLIGFILLLIFFSGMGFESFLYYQRDASILVRNGRVGNTLTTDVTGDEPDTNSANSSNNGGVASVTITTKSEVINGEITLIEPVKIDVKGKDGVTKSLVITQKTVVISAEGVAVKSSELKVGDNIIAYANKGENDTYTVERIKILL